MWKRLPSKAWPVRGAGGSWWTPCPSRCVRATHSRCAGRTDRVRRRFCARSRAFCRRPPGKYRYCAAFRDPLTLSLSPREERTPQRPLPLGKGSLLLLPLTSGRCTRLLLPLHSGRGTRLLPPLPSGRGTRLLLPLPSGRCTRLLLPLPSGRGTRLLLPLPSGRGLG